MNTLVHLPKKKRQAGCSVPFTEQSWESVGAEDGAQGGGGKPADAHIVVLQHVQKPHVPKVTWSTQNRPTTKHHKHLQEASRSHRFKNPIEDDSIHGQADRVRGEDLLGRNLKDPGPDVHPLDVLEEGQDKDEAGAPDGCQGEGGAKDNSSFILRDTLEDEEEGEGGGEDNDGEGEEVEECCHHLPQAWLFRPLQVH